MRAKICASWWTSLTHEVNWIRNSTSNRIMTNGVLCLWTWYIFLLPPLLLSLGLFRVVTLHRKWGWLYLLFLSLSRTEQRQKTLHLIIFSHNLSPKEKGVIINVVVVGPMFTHFIWSAIHHFGIHDAILQVGQTLEDLYGIYIGQYMFFV